MKAYTSLRVKIYNAKFNNGAPQLTDAEQASFYKFLAHGTRGKTRAKLSRMVELPLSLFANVGIFDRVLFDSTTGEVDYCAGQCYTTERAIVRDCILDPSSK